MLLSTPLRTKQNKKRLAFPERGGSYISFVLILIEIRLLPSQIFIDTEWVSKLHLSDTFSERWIAFRIFLGNVFTHSFFFLLSRNCIFPVVLLSYLIRLCVDDRYCFQIFSLTFVGLWGQSERSFFVFFEDAGTTLLHLFTRLINKDSFILPLFLTFLKLVLQLPIRANDPKFRLVLQVA